jgi:hypothetical protein
LSESECYARLYGDREPTVAVLRESDSEAVRPGGGRVGDQIMKIFAERLHDATDELPDEEAAA